MNSIECLKQQILVSIGVVVDKKCVIVEGIAENPTIFIETVVEKGLYISAIHWWDRSLISQGSQIGYGGPRDPRDPEKYYFAEMDIFATFDKETNVLDYIEYINRIKSQYLSFDIYPAFDVYER